MLTAEDARLAPCALDRVPGDVHVDGHNWAVPGLYSWPGTAGVVAGGKSVRSAEDKNWNTIVRRALNLLGVTKFPANNLGVLLAPLVVTNKLPPVPCEDLHEPHARHSSNPM